MRDPVVDAVGSLSEYLGITEISMQLFIGAGGLVLLGISFHSKSEDNSRVASVIGWPFIGLFFYLYSGHYVEIADPVLILMTAGALPAGLAMAYWEWKTVGVASDTLVWLRGCVVWSMIPYYPVSYTHLTLPTNREV